ncbi:MAG: hypothetical protein DWI22_18115 [Planctomycetota bacterium]|nr:MAG: hypothetical protein DWI22_18115 [Planctomycetota bacterium]
MERLVTTRSTGRTAALGQSLPAGKSAAATAWRCFAASWTAISGKPRRTLHQTLHRNPRLHPLLRADRRLDCDATEGRITFGISLGGQNRFAAGFSLP